MCGRFILSVEAESIENVFGIKIDLPFFGPRYNIAPGQNVPVIRKGPEKREFSMMRWGLVPHWAKDMKIGYKMINARAETIDQKPSFKSAFLNRRCLIPADGFYEWKQLNGKKQPMFIRLPEASLFAFTGIWENWASPDGNNIYSCSLITTSANKFIRSIHDRMPVILNKPDEYEAWLSSDNTLEVKSMLNPYTRDLSAYPVSTMVNSAKIDSPKLIEIMMTD